MNVAEVHACRMPWRRSRWMHKIYICNRDTAWTVKQHYIKESAESPIGPSFSYHWYQVKGVEVVEK